jgi:hypothetical protein
MPKERKNQTAKYYATINPYQNNNSFNKELTYFTKDNF